MLTNHPAGGAVCGGNSQDRLAIRNVLIQLPRNLQRKIIRLQQQQHVASLLDLDRLATRHPRQDLHHVLEQRMSQCGGSSGSGTSIPPSITSRN